MKRFPRQSPGLSRRWLAVPAAVAFAVLAAGIAFGVHFASEAIHGTSVAQEAEQSTAAAPAAQPSPPPVATPEPSPEPTAPAATPQASWGPLGCIDCPVKGGQQLRVTAEDIQLGPDGRYYVPDRGDGCAYQEGGRGEVLGVEVVSLWAPNCEEGIDYEPATGRVHVLIP